MINNTIYLLSLLTLLSQLFLLLVLLLLLTKYRTNLSKLIFLHGNKLLFLIALTATSGSLFFSQIANFDPCELCWFQRIFMYPLVILFGLAWYWKENSIYKYTFPLVTLGWLIAVYHNYIYYQGLKSTFCRITSHASCITPYFTEFGFITIPVMSLTAFSLIGFLLFTLNKNTLK